MKDGDECMEAQFKGAFLKCDTSITCLLNCLLACSLYIVWVTLILTTKENKGSYSILHIHFKKPAQYLALYSDFQIINLNNS